MASEIRVDKITSLSGVGTISPSPTGVEIAGITTTATLKATTGIVTTLTATTGIVTTLTTNTLTANSTAKVGSGVTLSPDGDVFATGISTFSGGLKTSGGNITIKQPAGTDATLEVNEGTTNNNFIFRQSATQCLIQTGASIPLNIRAQGGAGSGQHLALWTRESERIRIQSAGNIGIGTSAPATILHVQANAGDMLRLDRDNTGSVGNQIAFRHSASGTLTETGSINCVSTANADTGQLRFYTKESGGSNTEKLRILSSGGITFNGDTATANALDDYEEGDWTPTFDTSNASGSITVNSYNVQYGKYVKIGKMVYVEGVIRGNVTNNSNGTYDLGGLPFTVDSTTNASGILHGKEQTSWTVAPDHFSCIANTTRARARGGLTVGDSAYTNANTSGFNSGSATNNRIYIAGSYRVKD